MSRVYVGSLRGVSLYFDVLVIPAVIAVCISGGLGLWLLLLPSFAIHELSHLLAAHLFEMDVSSFVLLPTGGILSVDVTGKHSLSRKVALYLFAPFTNVMIFCVSWAMGVASDSLLLMQTALVNGFIAAVSLLPVCPFDGGNAFKAILLRCFNERRATNILFVVSLIFAGAIFGAFVFLAVAEGEFVWQLLLITLLFVHYAISDKRKCTSNFVSNIINKDKDLKKHVTLVSKCIYVINTASIRDALKAGGHDTVNTYRIVDNDFNVICEFTEGDLLDMAVVFGTSAKLSDVLQKK
ncbi:MAG: hypothetical protein E7312_00570 [Clostridiales bacterium]|nr:hypothetical protein [Clostridiales bacterium]